MRGDAAAVDEVPAGSRGPCDRAGGRHRRRLGVEYVESARASALALKLRRRLSASSGRSRAAQRPKPSRVSACRLDAFPALRAAATAHDASQACPPQRGRPLAPPDQHRRTPDVEPSASESLALRLTAQVVPKCVGDCVLPTRKACQRRAFECCVLPTRKACQRRAFECGADAVACDSLGRLAEASSRHHCCDDRQLPSSPLQSRCSAQRR